MNGLASESIHSAQDDNIKKGTNDNIKKGTNDNIQKGTDDNIQKGTNDGDVFRAFVNAGERLAEIHVHYEKQPEYPLTKTEKAGKVGLARYQNALEQRQEFAHL